ncbi:MAG TPA: isoprenylcysteine carboxylmethyltransferase family protein [Ktedonosporobacter sp.]|nr:isoprenylcysteine carboxylmethyltransferase family protein [Ktedonosporobacter sp.]
MLPLFIAYGLIIFFIAVERFLRRGETAKTLKAQPQDRGSTLLIGLAFAWGMLVLLIAAFLPGHIIGSLNGILNWVGIALMLSGLLLRIWAARTLGEFYTRTLVVDTHQVLVEEGPYRWLRHPGYFGDIVLWLGAGLASGNILVLVAIAAIVLPAYIYRINVEEVMLHQRFGTNFDQYTKRRKKVIPFLY